MSGELKLEVGKTYVFKDESCRSSFLSASSNVECYEDNYKNGFKIGYVTPIGEGYSEDETILIAKNEIYLFKEKPQEEEQTSPQTNNIWDGISDLEVDMVVGRKCSGRTPFKIKYVGVDYCILESVDDKVEHSVKIGNIMTLQPTHKEETFEKVLSAWNKSSLENAYDGKNSIVGLEDFFNVMYDVMK